LFIGDFFGDFGQRFASAVDQESPHVAETPEDYQQSYSETSNLEKSTENPASGGNFLILLSQTIDTKHFAVMLSNAFPAKMFTAKRTPDRGLAISMVGTALQF
jgi:hypothetical protein